MAEIKDLSRIASKWKRVAGSAGTEYEEGVRNPKGDWQKNTKAAEKSYEQGIQNAISRKAFGKGVDKAGTEKWQQNAIKKGPVRFQQGVSESGNNYESGFGPYRDVIANTNLPERGPKGDPKNINRVAVMAKALHDAKLQRSGG